MEKKMLIEGMKCEHCKMRVEKALAEITGVTKAAVDLEEKTARIDLSTEVPDEILMEAVRAKNFIPVKML